MLRTTQQRAKVAARKIAFELYDEEAAKTPAFKLAESAYSNFLYYGK